ncbi:MAG: hypothetical protein MJZ24_11375 [Paludibacteraceae bacterium]|nr:hypothetical protein [Paludibacteraceae bacterium]
MEVQKKKVKRDAEWSTSKKVAFAASVGISVASLTSCVEPKPEPLAGDVAIPIDRVESLADSNGISSDSIGFSSESALKICEKDSLGHETDSISPALVDVNH